jgi:hypothetical protein
VNRKTDQIRDSAIRSANTNNRKTSAIVRPRTRPCRYERASRLTFHEAHDARPPNKPHPRSVRSGRGRGGEVAETFLSNSVNRRRLSADVAEIRVRRANSLQASGGATSSSPRSRPPDGVVAPQWFPFGVPPAQAAPVPKSHCRARQRQTTGNLKLAKAAATNPLLPIHRL